MRQPSALMVAVLVAALLATSACGGDDEPAADDPATSSLGTADTASVATDGTEPTDGTDPPPTTGDTTPTSDEEAVLAAVDCYWTTIVEANDPPDPDHPGFDRCFTGAALQHSRDITRNHALLGQTVTDPTTETQRFGSLVTVNGDTAVVLECIIDDAVVSDRVTGTVLNDRVISADIRIELERAGSTWKVANGTVERDQLGAEGCESA